MDGHPGDGVPALGGVGEQRMLGLEFQRRGEERNEETKRLTLAEGSGTKNERGQGESVIQS